MFWSNLGTFHFWSKEGANIFGRVAKGGAKNFDASLRGAENFGPPIVLESLGVNKYTLKK